MPEDVRALRWTGAVIAALLGALASHACLDPALIPWILRAGGGQLSPDAAAWVALLVDATVGFVFYAVTVPRPRRGGA